jgi:ADP-ribose pyrophosphatase YjhB (NUDIX family)
MRRNCRQGDRRPGGRHFFRNGDHLRDCAWSCGVRLSARQGDDAGDYAIAATALKLPPVTERLTVTIGRRAARAILIDDQGRLVLIKRTKPGQAPYWTTPGGGVERTDASVEAALHRELAEELGAEAAEATQVFLFSSPSGAEVAVAHFFVARLVRMDEAARSGPEFADPGRGRYDVDLVDLFGDDLTGIDLKPGALKEFILANREALLAEAGPVAGRSAR